MWSKGVLDLQGRQFGMGNSFLFAGRFLAVACSSQSPSAPPPKQGTWDRHGGSKKLAQFYGQLPTTSYNYNPSDFCRTGLCLEWRCGAATTAATLGRRWMQVLDRLQRRLADGEPLSARKVADQVDERGTPSQRRCPAPEPISTGSCGILWVSMFVLFIVILLCHIRITPSYISFYDCKDFWP